MSVSVGAFVVVVLPGDEPLAAALRADLAHHHPEAPVLMLSERPLDGTEHRALGDVVLDDISYAELAMCWARDDLRAALVPAGVRAAHGAFPGATAVLLRPGLRVLGPLLPALVDATETVGLVAAVPRDTPADDLEPDGQLAALLGPASHAIVVAAPGAEQLLRRWETTVSPRHWAHELPRPLFAVAAEAVLAHGARVVADHNLLRDPRWGWEERYPAALDLSFVDADHPWRLDPALARPRVLLSHHPTLASLVDEHVRQVGRVQASETTTPLLARLARQRLAETAPEPLDEWLAAPVGGQPPSPMPRALAALWEARPDLRALMPRALHQDARVFARWWLDHGHVEHPLPDRVVTAVKALEAADLDVAVPEPTAGITVAGYVGATLGLGRMARLLIDAARHAGLEVSVVENHRTSSKPATDRPMGLPQGFLHTLTVVAVTGDQLPAFAADLPPGWRDDRRTVGVWAWELDELPETHRHGFVHVDEVWTISEFTRASIARVAPCPVDVVPLPVPVPEVPPSAAQVEALRDRLGLPSRPYLLFAFDLLSDFERKNPLGLVEAHRLAFPATDGPLLVLKVLNMDLRVGEAERLRLAVSGRDDVIVVEETLPSEDVETLMAGALGYVSLHRSEGFGLTLAEAMALGVPCVATAYGGNLDFMDDEVALMVPYELVPVPAHSAYAGGRWAEPDLEAAASAMRRLAEHPELVRQLGRRGRDRVAETCSVERTAAFLEARVPAPEPASGTAEEAPVRAPETTRLTRLRTRLASRRD